MLLALGALTKELPKLFSPRIDAAVVFLPSTGPHISGLCATSDSPTPIMLVTVDMCACGPDLISHYQARHWDRRWDGSWRTLSLWARSSRRELKREGVGRKTRPGNVCALMLLTLSKNPSRRKDELRTPWICAFVKIVWTLPPAAPSFYPSMLTAEFCVLPAVGVS